MQRGDQVQLTAESLLRARQEITCTFGCQMMVGCGRFQSEKTEEYLGYFEDFSL